MDQAFKERYDLNRKSDTNKFKACCYAPFGNLYFSPLGYVGNCCHNQTEPTAIGNIAKQRLPEIWNGLKAKAVRGSVKNYVFPDPTCSFCSWQANSGNVEGVYARRYDRLKVDPKAEWPFRIEFAMSNACNFACTMCNGDYSSLIRKKIEQRPPLPKVYDDQFFQDLEDFIPSLREAAFLGGEPFLGNENFRVWDMLIAQKKGDHMFLKVTTNGSILNDRVKEVLDCLPFHFTISIEGITKDTQDKIRVGSDLDLMMRNIKWFNRYAEQRGTRVNYAHCLMVQNWHGFSDLVQFVEDQGTDMGVHSVRQPFSHSLYKLPAPELETIVAKLESEREQVLPRLEINGP
ncbi:MAG: radical SAM protein, partial [Planctomycetota bacterium]